MILVFTYHSVSRADYAYAVTPERFARELAYIQRHFKIISLPQFEKIIDSGEMPTGKQALITFDDGLRDNYTNALPVLVKFGIPATLFLAAGLAGGKFASSAGEFDMCSWEELANMDRAGFDIQSHTFFHPKLNELTEREVEEEFAKTNVLIEEKLAKKPRYLAYPKNHFNSMVERVARAHYRLAFGSSGAILALQGLRRTAVPRVTIHASLPEWKFRLMSFPWYWRLKDFYDIVRGKSYGTHV